MLICLLLQRHALNVLKDDLIIRLDQLSNEMVILREEIKSLQTVKASLQHRINELEDEAKKHREEMAERAKKQEEEEVSRRRRAATTRGHFLWPFFTIIRLSRERAFTLTSLA